MNFEALRALAQPRCECEGKNSLFSKRITLPFGSYAVEQHGGGCERPQRCVPEPHATEQPQSNSDSKELQKAA
jgi:hypothetical protein